MIRSISVIASLCAALSVASAQQSHHSKIVVGHPGLNALKSDIRYLLSLTTPKEQSQEENVIGIIEIMELGLDLTRPMRVDVLSGMNPPGFIVSAGYESSGDILENIEGTGYALKEISKDTFWELLPPDLGWFRILSRSKTAILGFSDPESNHGLMKQLILKMSDPLPAVKPLIADGSNIAIELKNPAQSAEDQKLRRSSFAELRAVRMDALQKRPSETTTRFDVRKELVSIQIDEVERLLVEANAASASIRMDKNKGTATIRFAADGIPESPFAKSLAKYGKRIDVFASVKKTAGAIFHVRANFPVDDMRLRNTNDIINLIEKDAVARMQDNAKLSAEEKTASEELARGTLKIARDTIGIGNVNGFAETLLDAKGEFMTYGAFESKDATRLDDILALVAKTGKGNSIKPAIAKIGDITIHEVTFAKGYFRPFDLVFEGKTGFIGTSDNVVWIGTGGAGVLEPMKAAISNLKKPAESDVILKFDGNVLPWAKRAKRVLENDPEPTSTSEKATRRDNIRYLGLAVEAFQERDDFHFDMSAENGKSSGEIVVNLGMLKFVAKLLADFSENNLQ